MTTATASVNPAYIAALDAMTLAEVQSEIDALREEITEVVNARARYNSLHWAEAPYWTGLERKMVKAKNWEYFHGASIAINRHWGALQARLWAAQDRAAALA